jgi:hypothetical protein
VVTELELLATDPRSLKEASDEDVIALLNRWRYTVAALIDTSTAELPDVEAGSTFRQVVDTCYQVISEVREHPGSAQRLSKKLQLQLRAWRKNAVDIEELHLDRRSTPREIFDLVDDLTSIGVEHRASEYDIYDKLTDAILEWYDDSSTKKSSRSQSRTPKVRFAEEEEDPPSPLQLPETPQKGKQPAEPETPTTSRFVPTARDPSQDHRLALQLARERDAAIRERVPQFDLLSQEERALLREDAADSPGTNPEVYGLSTPPRRFRTPQQSPSRQPRNNTPAEEALTKLLIRDISPRPQ